MCDLLLTVISDFSLMAWVTASSNISAEKKTVYENPVVIGNLGKTGKSNQS